MRTSRLQDASHMRFAQILLLTCSVHPLASTRGIDSVKLLLGRRLLAFEDYCRHSPYIFQYRPTQDSSPSAHTFIFADRPCTITRLMYPSVHPSIHVPLASIGVFFTYYTLLSNIALVLCTCYHASHVYDLALHIFMSIISLLGSHTRTCAPSGA
jgi:hypothetical protein